VAPRWCKLLIPVFLVVALASSLCFPSENVTGSPAILPKLQGSAVTSGYGDNFEDFVDAISDLHIADTDVGTHSSFAEMQDKDGVYDTLTEGDTGGTTQVTYVSSGAGSASITTTCTPGYPSTLTAGNLLLGEVMILDTATAPSSFNGFTALLGPYTSGTDARVWIYYKYSDGTESGTATVSRASGTTGFFARIHNFRYVHQTIGSAYEAVNWVSEGSVSTILDRGVTTTGTKELAINFVYNGEDTNTYVSFTSESGGDWTEVVAQYSNGAGNDGTLQLQCATMAAAGTVDGGSYNAVAADPTGVLGLALKPATIVNYDLDLEVGWTTADYDEAYEELCVFGSTQGTEALRVDIWSGSWTNVISDVAEGWNNVSVSSYLTGAAFEVRFTDTSDEATLADAWLIEAVLLHVWTGALLNIEVFQVVNIFESTTTAETVSITVNEEILLDETPVTVMSAVMTIFQTIVLAGVVSSKWATSLFVFENIVIASIVTTTLSTSITLNGVITISGSAVANILSGEQFIIFINAVIDIPAMVSTILNTSVTVFGNINLLDFVLAEINPPIIVVIYALIPIGESAIIIGGLEGINIFYDLFLTTDLWGLFGPLGLVVISYFMIKKARPLGIFFIIVDSVILAQYFALVDATPFYWWQIFVLILGVIQCMLQMISK